MKDFLVALFIVLLFLGVVFTIFVAVNDHTKCESGQVDPCVWTSPYTDQREVGKQICGADGHWGSCHPLCSEE